MIHLDDEVIAVDDIWKTKSVVGPGSGNVLLREQPEDLRAQAILRPAGSRIRRPRGCDVGSAGNRDRQRRTGPPTFIFESYKEERAIMFDRPAGRRAVVVVLERTFGSARQR